jgi:hypothetical protein
VARYQRNDFTFGADAIRFSLQILFWYIAPKLHLRRIDKSQANPTLLLQLSLPI